jgi:hypothetical protein
MKHDPEKYKLAVDLRRMEKSYSEIFREIGVSKSTLSNWFSHFKFSQEVTSRLIQLRAADSSNRIMLMNAACKAKLEQKYDELKNAARLEYIKLRKQALFLVGLSLYWGEGSKTHNNRVSIINSDPDMLCVAVNFFRDVLLVHPEKIRAELFIHSDLKEDVAKKYWSKKLKIDSTNFIKTQILPSRAIRTKRKMEHGLCTVYCSNTELSIKIRVWIEELAKEMRE